MRAYHEMWQTNHLQGSGNEVFLGFYLELMELSSHITGATTLLRIGVTYI